MLLLIIVPSQELLILSHLNAGYEMCVFSLSRKEETIISTTNTDSGHIGGPL